jgi:hypothetical protein
MPGGIDRVVPDRRDQARRGPFISATRPPLPALDERPPLGEDGGELVSTTAA